MDTNDSPDVQVAPMSQRQVRTALLATAKIFMRGFEQATVRLRNLSTGGMGGWGELSLQPGDMIVVRLKGIGDVPGKLAWKNGKRFGIRFDTAIDTDRLQRSELATTPISDSVMTPRSFEPVCIGRRPGLR